MHVIGNAAEGSAEGIRRIGEIVREQVELYGTLTGLAPKASPRREAPPERPPAPEPQPQPANTSGASVLPLRRKRA